MKVHISPTASQVTADNGVGRVVLAQHQYLPAFGVELTSADQADVIAAHINADGLPRVDALHLHGLYWTGDPNSGQYTGWHRDSNRRTMDAARKARAITVPSAWVAEPFRRDMRLTPEVIGHGIDLSDWPIAESRGYVLWNKNRNADVCDPSAAADLARRGIDVVSTFGPRDALPERMRIVGTQPHDRMKLLVQHADVYLATTKETFGIGTLEALAAGVPVLGYAWAGTADLVRHEETGYLVTPGDIDGLMDGLAYIRQHRRRLSATAREAAGRHDWRSVMGRYAALYRRLAQPEPSGVTVVITNYNYGEYASAAINSALRQTRKADEVIVVDDGSDDGGRSFDVLEQYQHVARIIRQPNQGVAAARNTGIAAAAHPFIICLDADDELAPDYIATLVPAMQAERSLGIAYTGLSLLHPDGSLTENAWPPAFNWEAQTTPHNPPSNCIPCAAMFRRAMWERAGGYTQVYAPAEDTEFWTRGLSVGFTARKVADEGLFHYRVGHSSASRTKEYKPIDAWHPWMRDQQYPMAAPAKTQPLVRSYSEPVVSVVIPVGPGHAQYLPAALDSLLGQTFRNWDVIVINDGGGDLPLGPYPFVRGIDIGTANGVAEARNEGLDWARAPLVLFLDADDYLMPTALDTMLRAYAQSDGRYIYSDWVTVNGDTHRVDQAPDWTRDGWLQAGQHAVTALIPTMWARDVGGFDTELPGWEDWDFFIKLTIAGYCGQRVSEALLAYRQHTGQRRAESFERADATKAILRDRYGDYTTGAKPMGGCCGGNGDALLKVKQSLGEGEQIQSLTLAPDLPDGMARMEYIGPETGAISFFGAKGRVYRGANNAHDRYTDADAIDVERLVGSGKWRLVVRPRVTPPPVAIEIVTAAPAPEPVLVPAGFEDDDEDAAAAAAADQAAREHTARRRRR